MRMFRYTMIFLNFFGEGFVEVKESSDRFKLFFCFVERMEGM